jgi:uncharacterized protein (TIGR02246 family)
VAAATGAETGTGSQAEIAAIRAAAANYLAAVRSGNGDDIRRLWTPEGDYIDASGQHFKAHELLGNQHPAATTPSPDSNAGTAKTSLPSSSLRLITPEVAIEDGAADLGIADDGNRQTGRFTAVWVKRDGRWLLDSLREGVVASTSANDELQSLSWLLGEWAGVADDHAIVVSSNWTAGGKYIVREFAIYGDGDELVTATERIGWDPVRGQIVSWTFDSQGGRSEGRWTRDGERWLVEGGKVMADGKTAKTTSIYTPGDGKSYVWETTRATIADEQLPPTRIEFEQARDDE